MHCRIKERIEITTCYKCLEFGHIASKCRGANRAGAYYRCGMTNHKAKDCKNPERCVSCNESGHRADSTRCPRYKELLKMRVKA